MNIEDGKIENNYSNIWVVLLIIVKRRELIFINFLIILNPMLN
jgi:hypothetical protein